MAKISFSKLNLKKVDKIEQIEYNEQWIEIKQYLPIQQKLELLSSVITKATDNSKFFNPGQLSVFFKLEIVQAYTNINFTEKQKEDFCKTFDLLEENGLFLVILNKIPTEELKALEAWLLESIKAIYEYNNSARALLESLKTDYNNLDFDISSLQEKIKDPQSLELLKEIAPLLDLD